ncbi:MAG: alanine racemase [Spirochaetales bacterium]|nr:alanine racemase [Spirochaetales bacterium]
MRNTSVVIHLDHFLTNIEQIRKVIGPHIKISASVKADAYGHGAVALARAAERAGIDFLGIACPEEGVELREAGIRIPLLLYGLCLPGEIDRLIDLDISAVVADSEGIDLFARSAARLKKKARLHLKIDTGMGRIGCKPEEALPLARQIASSPHLELEGVATHFPISDETDRTFTEQQIRLFQEAVETIRKEGIQPGILHASNSGGILQYPEAHFSMVRPGILLYGYFPSHQVPRALSIRPVMELKASVLFLKKVSAGTPISYGCTYHTPAPTTIATLGAGYADGYPRSLSNRGRVLIRGKCYPIVGRVTMDQIMVDVGKDPEVERYDDAVLFGPDPIGPNAEEVAGWAGTIPYEITCGINRRIPREYRDG